MDVSLSSDVLNQLNTNEARALHDISDSLSACGVGKIVHLPQIIVVGEQSSGKSSVLEAISHVRFPVEGGVCTRFATELVLRQAPETGVDVSVRFADKSKAPRSFQRTGFREDDLPDIIKEAKECMGFTGAEKEFFKDVLRLEIQGPSMYPLTLVDLPGLFPAETEAQSLSGKEIVDELVESYMRQKNSIILVVISANSQLASHVALRRVKEIDPQRQRTIGVITKPDLTHTGLDDERTYIRVAKNQESANKLHLGWHVLRNRPEKETSLVTRDKVEEKFFKAGAWAKIPRNDCGIASLRKKLSRVLYDHIRSSLPGVVEDIEGNLRERQDEFDRLGKPRSTKEDKRSFLLAIAGDFQRLARDGVYGRYNEHRFFGGLESEDRKLRAQLRNFNRAFDHILKTRGSKQLIVENNEGEQEDVDLPEYLEAFLERYDFQDPEIITTAELNAQLRRHAAANQGREFPGSLNSDLAILLFKKQAMPWREIAECHIRQVTHTAKAFVDDLFRYVTGPPNTNRTTEAILSTCVDPFFDEKEKLLRDKLEELLRPYVEGYAIPLDVDLYHSLSQKSMKRLFSRFCGVIRDKHPETFEEDSKKQLTEKIFAKAAFSDDFLQDGEFGTDKVIDMMRAYYEISRRTFTENIINLAIESCLVSDIPTILTPTKVDRMSLERLEELAAESDDTISRRQTLQEELEILRRGLTQCRRYRPRPVTGMGIRQVNLTRIGDPVRPSSHVKVSPSSTKSAFTTTSTATATIEAPPSPPLPKQSAPPAFQTSSSSLAAKPIDSAPPFPMTSSTSERIRLTGLTTRTAPISKPTEVVPTDGSMGALPKFLIPNVLPASKPATPGTPISSALDSHFPLDPQTGNSSGIFRSKPAPPSAAGSGLFGSNPAPPSTAGSGLFGSKPANHPAAGPSEMFGSRSLNAGTGISKDTTDSKPAGSAPSTTGNLFSSVFATSNSSTGLGRNVFGSQANIEQPKSGGLFGGVGSVTPSAKVTRSPFGPNSEASKFGVKQGDNTGASRSSSSQDI